MFSMRPSASHGVLGLEGGDEPGVVDDGLHDARELAALGARALDDARELADGVAGLGREQALLGHARWHAARKGMQWRERVASESFVTLVEPMPRRGVLTTRRALTSSDGFTTSLR